jgi:hypothetical protein
MKETHGKKLCDHEVSFVVQFTVLLVLDECGMMNWKGFEKKR